MRTTRIVLFVVLFAVLGIATGVVIRWWQQPPASGTDRVTDAQAELPPALVSTGGDAAASISASRHNAITRAAAEVGRAVTAVSIVQTRVVQTRPGLDDFWSQFFFPRFYREQVRSMGSGVIVTQDGYVLTNEHVTSGADSIWVTLSDGRTLPARLIGSDHQTDLAVLKVDAESLPSVRLGNSDALLIGEWAIALGNPFGYLLDDSKPTVTVGVISALDRDVKRAPDDNRIYRKVIQTDAAINPGNSGGPLVNADGELIGINSFIFSSSRGSEGIGFAIPVNQARVVMADLIRYGELRPAWIGVRLQAHAGPSGPEGRVHGVLVAAVLPDSPAERTGIQAGDVIMKAGDDVVHSLADWEGEASYWRPGDRVDVVCRRGTEIRTVTLKLDNQPLLVAPSVRTGYGMEVVDMDGAIAAQLGMPNSRGAAVARVRPSSAAEAAGLQRGDIIYQVGHVAVSDAATLTDLLRRGQGHRLIVRLVRNGQPYRAVLE